MSTLEHAVAVAAKAHEGQVDKAGAPYLLHPLRMMLRLSTAEERIVAVLHDVIEGCGYSFDRLRAEGFSEAVIAAVDSVTRRSGETYEAFVLRAAANPVGRRVKLVDLQDNCDLSRISSPGPGDYERVEKYKRAIAVIESFHRLPTASDFPPGTEFVIDQTDVPLVFVPGKGWLNWFGGAPGAFDPSGLKQGENRSAESFEEWAGIVAESLKRT